MDKQVTFRFYGVRKHSRKNVAFGDAVESISEIIKPSNREATLSADFELRLERLQKEPGDILVGEITRIQKTNLPSEVKGDDIIPLTTKNPLGHGVVFRYNKTKSVLGIQYDVRVASPGRFVQYIEQMIDGAAFVIEPIVRNDQWSRFNNGPSRKVTIAIASPTDLDDLQRGGAASAASSFRAMGEAYDAPMITIELSMGQRPGMLSEATKSLVKYFRDKAISGTVDVRKLQATVKDEDAPKDDIDLLQDILSVKQALPLEDNNPDKNFKIKTSALKDQMNVWIK